MVVLVLAFAASAAAQVPHRASPENYLRLIKQLRPGETLTLAPGEYGRGLPVHRLGGKPGQPITIEGPPQGLPAVLVARAGRNTISIVDSSHVVIRNLTLEGRGLRVDAVKAEGHARFARDITLENLVIRGHGHDQQTVGISTKCPAWHWVIRGNTIIGAGTGMYFGDSDGSAPFVAGLIERNLVLDSLGYNLQVKHQQPRPALEGMPSDRSLTVIRHNVFAKPNAGTKEMARPNVLVGHFPVQSPGADDRYAVYGNFFYQNRHEALFQGEGNIALYSNLFVNLHGDAVRIQPHKDIPRAIDIAYNTVLAARAGISIRQRPGAAAHRHRVAANAVFAAIPISGGERSGNTENELAVAVAFLRDPFAEPGSLDLRPREGLPLVRVGDILEELPDAERDFDGNSRIVRTVGAYSAAAERRWLPALDRKPH